MSINTSLERIAQHYKEHSDYQLTRLDKDSPVEYAITLRKLNRWITENSIIADVGTGAGHYALQLAKRHCRIHLIDIADNLLQECHSKFLKAELLQYILSINTATATDLSFISDESVDAVLLLGPLYHLNTAAERRTSLKEAQRILKKGGYIFAAGINRLAVFRELWNINRFDLKKDRAPTIKQTKGELLNFINTGIANEQIFPPLSDAFFATASQFREEFAGFFNELEFLGLESFTAHRQNEFLLKDDDQKSEWLDLVEITGRTNEGIASSEHFLFIGEKIS